MYEKSLFVRILANLKSFFKQNDPFTCIFNQSNPCNERNSFVNHRVIQFQRVHFTVIPIKKHTNE